MARQKGNLRFSGSIGDLNFYYSKDNGWLVRQKSLIDAKRFWTDAAFERSRESATSFGSSSREAKCLRDPFRECWNGLADSKLCQRSVALISKVKNHDTLSDRGQFLVMNALQNSQAQKLFEGFSFNHGPSISNILMKDYITDLETGAIKIPGLNPAEHLSAPHAATHVSFTSALAKINFDTKETRYCLSEQAVLQLGNTSTDVILLPQYMPVLANSFTLLTLKIVFYQYTNGDLHLLNDKKHCIIEIIAAGFTQQP